MKKVLSLVLVIAMILSSFSFAFAANFEDVEGDYEKAINTLVGLGVVTGYEDGTFKPERIVTRAEMAKLIVEILGYGDLVAGSKSNFADTQGHWADSWIALAAGRGLVVGTGDGNFTPDRQVSYDEAITMIVRALGYTDDCNELKGMTWPTNFKVKAADLKLTKDVKLVGTGADRGGVAQLLFNALEANMVTVDTDGNVNYVKDGEDNKILLNALAKKDRFVVAPKHLDKDDKAYMGDIVDLAPYMYQDIKVFVNDDDEVVYVTKVESEVKVGEFRRTDDNSDGKYAEDGEVFIRIDGKNKAYDLFQEKNKDVAIPVFYNGAEVVMDETEMEIGSSKVVDLNRAAATFVLNDDDEIVGIVANKFTDALRVENEYNGKARFEGIYLPLDDDDEVDYDRLTVTGEVDALEDIEEDDVIVLFASAGEKTPTKDTEKLVIQVVRNTVEGKITRTNSDGEFYIDGKYYAASQFADDDFEVGLEGTYFLDHQGRLVAFVEEDDGPKDYAVIVELLEGVIKNGRTLADAEMTIVNAAGEEVTYKFDSKLTKKVWEKVEEGEEGEEELDGTIKILPEIAEYDVIKYSVNSKGRISKVTGVYEFNENDAKAKEKDITGKSYVFASNVVVFNYVDSEDDEDVEVEVVDVDDLGDEVVILAQKENKNGEIEMFYVKGLGATATYAYIVDEGTMWNDDDERVQSLTAYVDGVEVFYEADDLDVIDDDVIDTATIVKLHFNGDIVEGYTSEDVIDDKIAKTGTITRISGDRIRVTYNEGNEVVEKWFTLADDVAVYILDDGKFDEVGDKSSIYRDAEVRVYAFDEDNIKDEVVEILFILEGAPERPVTPPVEPVTETYIVTDYTAAFGRLALEDVDTNKSTKTIDSFDAVFFNDVEVSKTVMKAWFADKFKNEAEAEVVVEITEDNVLVVKETPKTEDIDLGDDTVAVFSQTELTTALNDVDVEVIELYGEFEGFHVSRDVTIKGGTIVEGAGKGSPYGNDNPGIYIDQDATVVIDGVTFDGDIARGIVTVSGKTVDLTVQNCTFDGIYNGIYLNPGVTGTIEGNTFTDIEWAAIGGYTDDVEIANNTFKNVAIEVESK